MTFRIFAVGLALSLSIAGTAIHAQEAPAAPAQPQTGAFVAPDFAVPMAAEGPGFTLVPLGPELVEIDYQAYMSSVEHLQQTFTRSTGWPRHDITAAEAMLDMETEEGRFQRRESFAYGVLTPDRSRERGSVYVAPSPVAGYDAVVRLWVTKADSDAGFDAELFAWTKAWIAREWPFARVAYPGRDIAWDAWDAEVQGSAAPAP